MTRIFTGENPKDRPIISFRGSVASTRTVRRDVSPRCSICGKFQCWHIQEYDGGIGGLLAGGKDMLLSKMLFGPFIELMTNRNYFGSEIWDINAPGYQQVQQALKHIASQQLSPMSVSGLTADRRINGYRA